MVSLNLGDVPADGWFPMIRVSDPILSNGEWKMDGALRSDDAVRQWLSEMDVPIAKYYSDYTFIVKTTIYSYDMEAFNDADKPNENIYAIITHNERDIAGEVEQVTSFQFGPWRGNPMDTKAMVTPPNGQYYVCQGDNGCIDGIERFGFDSNLSTGTSWTAAKAMPLEGARDMDGYSFDTRFNDVRFSPNTLL